MLPTRLVRFCCAELKETTTPNRLVAVGVREDESSGRKGRDAFQTWGGKNAKGRMDFFSLDHAEEVYRESKEINDPAWDCTLIRTAKEKADVLINPIYYWTEQDVIRYAHEQKITMNPLYYMGYRRVGCIGCPMASYKGRAKEFADFPKYKLAYQNAAEYIYKELNRKGLNRKFQSGQDLFDWWIEDPKTPGQMNIDDFLGGAE